VYGRRRACSVSAVATVLAFALLMMLLCAGAAYCQVQSAPTDVVISSVVTPNIAPLQWSGLLLNMDAEIDGKRFDVTCKAQFIAPRVLLTAAHCVQEHETGAWYDIDKMYFMLQYHDGQFSGLYRPVCLSRFDGWFPKIDGAWSEAERTRVIQSRYQWDYAMILVDHDSPAGYFNSEVEWKDKYRSATMIGYRSVALASQTIQSAFGALSFVSDRPNVVALAHPDRPELAPGTSGGGWIASFYEEASAEHNMLVGVSSYINTGSPGVSFGP
jgi:hypothetical protein